MTEHAYMQRRGFDRMMGLQPRKCTSDPPQQTSQPQADSGGQSHLVQPSRSRVTKHPGWPGSTGFPGVWSFRANAGKSRADQDESVVTLSWEAGSAFATSVGGESLSVEQDPGGAGLSSAVFREHGCRCTPCVTQEVSPSGFHVLGGVLPPLLPLQFGRPARPRPQSCSVLVIRGPETRTPVL